MDVNAIIVGDKSTEDQVKSYYKINYGNYKRFHSRSGFMHFHVTTSGDRMTEQDGFYQPDVVATHIKSGMSVLELGPGKGANIAYLANKFPDASFTGVDLNPQTPKKAPSNMKLIAADYRDMKQIPSESVDIAYGVETIVQCTSKEKVFEEVRRVLKPGGIFIVYDYALTDLYGTFDEDEQVAISLISKGAACPDIEATSQWLGYFEGSGFEKITVNDLSKEIMPDLWRLYKLARHIIDHPKRLRFLMKIKPLFFVSNVVIGYLGWASFNENVITYKEFTFRKPK